MKLASFFPTVTPHDNQTLHAPEMLPLHGKGLGSALDADLIPAGILGFIQRLIGSLDQILH